MSPAATTRTPFKAGHRVLRRRGRDFVLVRVRIFHRGPKAASGGLPASPQRNHDPEAFRVAWLDVVFNAMDADESGAIDLREFIATATTQQEEADLLSRFALLDVQVVDKLISWEEWRDGMLPAARQKSDEEFHQEMQKMLHVLQDPQGGAAVLRASRRSSQDAFNADK